MTTNEGTKAGRNDLCACGSGKKFKRCCGAVDVSGEDAASRFFGVATVLAGLMLVGGGLVFARALISGDGEAGKKVWSAEHGHYHTVGTASDSSEGGPGKVWNAEHGHYHSVGEASHSSEGGPGKVWNAEHGHYHNVEQGAVPLHADSPEPGALQGLRAAELEAIREKAAPLQAATDAPASATAESPDHAPE